MDDLRKEGSRYGYACVTALALACFVCISATCNDKVVVRLPGKIAAEANVGLALVANQALYAAYWEGARKNSTRQLVVYAIDPTTQELLASTRLARDEFKDVGLQHVRLYVSRDGALLLCLAHGTNAQGKAYSTVWTLRAQDLRVVSHRDLTDLSHHNLAVWGFTHTQNRVRLSITPERNQFDQVTVLDLDSSDLNREVAHRVVQLQAPAWMHISVDLKDHLWVLEKGKSSRGQKLVTAYDIKTGAHVVTQQLPPEQTSYGLLAVDDGVLVLVSQSPREEKGWCRVVRFGPDPGSKEVSATLTGCVMGAIVTSRDGRYAVANCESVRRTILDKYVIARMKLVLLSTGTGRLLQVQPLNKTNSLALAVDAGRQAPMVAVYDHRATVRLLSASD